MGPVRTRHYSHLFATQSSHFLDRARCQAKMASIGFWTPWRNACTSPIWCRVVWARTSPGLLHSSASRPFKFLSIIKWTNYEALYFTSSHLPCLQIASISLWKRYTNMQKNDQRWKRSLSIDGCRLTPTMIRKWTWLTHANMACLKRLNTMATGLHWW